MFLLSVQMKYKKDFLSLRFKKIFFFLNLHKCLIYNLQKIKKYHYKIIAKKLNTKYELCNQMLLYIILTTFIYYDFFLRIECIFL